MPKNHQYQPVNSIPLDDLSPDSSNPDPVPSHPEPLASRSRVSAVFEEIDRITRSRSNEDTFENDPMFRTVLDKSKGLNGFTKKSTGIATASAIVLWIIFAIYYSNEGSRDHARALWHGPNTNMASLHGKNVSLNSFSPHNQNLTLSKYRSAAFHTFDVPVRWLRSAQFPATHTSSARGFYFTSEGSKFMVKQVDTNYKQVILESTQFNYGGKFFYAENLILNPGVSVDNKTTRHLIRSNSITQWRHSYFSNWWVWKAVTGEIVPLVPPNTPSGHLAMLHFAQFSPSGTHIAFGHNHNIYILDIESMEVKSITDNGSPDIYNGKPDWVYEEEVYPQDKMIWWSPDSSRLAYTSINDTEVGVYDLNYYVKGSDEVAMSYEDIDRDGAEDVGKYPLRSIIRYPRPGTPNPTVRLYSYDLQSAENTEITGLADETISKDFILYDAAWLNSDNLIIKLSDRQSSVLVKKLYSPSKSSTAEYISTQNAADYDGWIEKAQPITVVKGENSTKYFDRVVVDNLVNLAVFDDARSQNYSSLLGPVNLASPLAYDSEDDSVFGMFGTNMNNTFSKITLPEKESSTPLQQKSFMKDLSADLIFSPDNLFVDFRYKGPGQPWQKLVRLAELEEDPKILLAMEPLNDVKRVSKAIKSTNLPTRIPRKVVVGHGDTQVKLNMIEILPPKFDPKKSYPLLVHGYGGPGSTTVDNTFVVDFQDVASSILNAVVLIIDPRGTGSDDWKIKAYANNKIGFWGPRDMTLIVSDYIKQNSFIDSSRTALWGWSYGAFLTLKTLESDHGKTFKYGIAVAPVTDWMFYDSIYTERYMNRPSENVNYDAVSRINNFQNFKDVSRFYIMHGTADDNVHIQNTLWLLDKFDKAEVENYDLHFFPDSDHSIYYHNANNIVYDKIMWWLQRAFQGSFD